MEEILKQILSEIKDIKQDVTDLKQDVNGLKQEVTDLKQDVNGLRQDVTDIKQDVIDLKDSQGRIEAKVNILSSELRSNFKHTHDKLDEHRKVFDVVSEEIKGVKVDIEYLS